MATGRSDYPNQVNNVLGFPFIFRGALDVRATAINEEMKLAAAKALAALAKEEVPDSVGKAYGEDQACLRPRLHHPQAVRPARPPDGCPGRRPGRHGDRRGQEAHQGLGRLRAPAGGRPLQVPLRPLPAFAKAKAHNKKIVFPEGEDDKIVCAAKIAVDEGLARPILLGNEGVIAKKLKEFNLPIDKVEVIDPKTSDKREAFARKYSEVRKRKGASFDEAKVLMNHPNYFGA